MTTNPKWAVSILVLIAITSCSRPRSVIMVDEKDPEMDAVIVEARSHVSEFVVALQSPQEGDRLFSVKTPIRDGEQVEHFWVGDIRYDGTTFTGILANDPEVVRGHKLGEVVSVVPRDISDWMFVRNDRLVGGYSVRLLRKRMTPAERTRWDSEVDFRID